MSESEYCIAIIQYFSPEDSYI